ncbi:GNAT family N-acetyltransferase [Candidatus Galacturonibacter soehngenii]|uniref:GNAT family N-acetyltransferase n=1 Tax=Candidatus Galacturonatibacter soehngenii TaxID=2307010 RepID=A0A7V7QLP1_9FIRM|nr:GNAT family N-acetyltransferase [Candidatus Galacturonibacter soehngenii]KAB1439486.1 GNAT family N-acetyltransferase [Candidatus Galacturonibacter soehngenii]
MSGIIDKNEISLRQANRKDISILEVWLNKDYIKKWYGEPDEWLVEIQNDSGDFNWLKHYIVMYQNTPIGFCQYFDCSHAPEGFEWDNEPQGTFAIDYLIGEEIFLKKGIGSEIIQKLCQLINSLEKPVQIVADPVPENIVSIKLLERNGFILEPTSGLYKLKIK